MIGMPGPAERSMTLWPLAISAPTLATSTRSRSSCAMPASSSAGGRRRPKLSIAVGESPERVDPDPGDHDVFHAVSRWFACGIRRGSGHCLGRDQLASIGNHMMRFIILDSRESRGSLTDTAVHDLTAEVEAFMGRNPVGHPPAGLDERFKWLVDFQRRLHEAGLAVVSWPTCSAGAGAARSTPSRSPRTSAAPTRPSSSTSSRPRSSPRRCWPSPRRNNSSAGCRRWHQPTRSGVSCSASPTPVRTSPRSGRRRLGRRGVAHHRDQGLEHLGAVRRQRSAPRPDRPAGDPAPHDRCVRDRHAPAGDRRPPARHDDRGRGVRRGHVRRSSRAARGRGGHVDEGWNVAMRMLENERGPYAMRRVAVLSAGITVLQEMAAPRRRPDPARAGRRRRPSRCGCSSGGPRGSPRCSAGEPLGCHRPSPRWR